MHHMTELFHYVQWFSISDAEIADIFESTHIISQAGSSVCQCYALKKWWCSAQNLFQVSVLWPIIYFYFYICVSYMFIFLATRHEQAHNSLITKCASHNRGGKRNLNQTQFTEFFLHLYPLLIWIKVSNSTLLKIHLRALLKIHWRPFTEEKMSTCENGCLARSWNKCGSKRSLRQDTELSCLILKYKQCSH